MNDFILISLLSLFLHLQAMEDGMGNELDYSDSFYNELFEQNQPSPDEEKQFTTLKFLDGPVDYREYYEYKHFFHQCSIKAFDNKIWYEVPVTRKDFLALIKYEKMKSNPFFDRAEMMEFSSQDFLKKASEVAATLKLESKKQEIDVALEKLSN